MPIGTPGDRQTDVPTFTSVRPVTSGIVRRNFGPASLSAALYVGGAPYSFIRNVKVASLVDVETGEWIAFDSGTGKIRKATSADPLAVPVWQGGSGRFDLAEGGLTGLFGLWEVLTNMVDIGDWQHGYIRVQDPLVVGVLPDAHPYAGRVGLVNYNDQAAGDFYVMAHVEDVYLDDVSGLPNGWVVINNHHAGKLTTREEAATTAAPTTA